jgi:hypothetical protein
VGSPACTCVRARVSRAGEFAASRVDLRGGLPELGRKREEWAGENKIEVYFFVIDFLFGLLKYLNLRVFFKNTNRKN